MCKKYRRAFGEDDLEVMTEKKKKGRRAYLEYFKKDDDGKYVFQGDYYTYQPEEGRTLRQELIRMWILCLIMFVSIVAVGCITAPGMDRSFYVLTPYVVELIGGIRVCLALGKLTAGGNPMKNYTYEGSVTELPQRTVFTMVWVAVSLVGETVFLCRSGSEGKILGMVLFFLLEILAGVSLFLFRRISLRMKWSK